MAAFRSASRITLCTFGAPTRSRVSSIVRNSSGTSSLRSSIPAGGGSRTHSERSSTSASPASGSANLSSTGAVAIAITTTAPTPTVSSARIPKM